VLERADQKTASFDLWLLDLASGNRAARLTVDGNASSPVWSSDGTQLLVMYRARGLVAMPWRGGGLNEVVANPASMWPSDWSNDGRRVAFGDIRSGRWRLLTAPAVGNEKPTVYREGPFELGRMGCLHLGRIWSARSLHRLIPDPGREDTGLNEWRGLADVASRRQGAVLPGT
jgi:hypothetical protein